MGGIDYAAIMAAINLSLDKSNGISEYEDAIAVLTEWKNGYRLTGRDTRAERLACRAIRERAVAASDSISDPYQMEKLAGYVEGLLAVNADDDFDSYMLYTEWGREPDKRFYAPRRSTMLTVANDLQDLFDDLLVFYALSTPPRVGKSTIGCFYMSFSMGNHPLDAHLMSGFSDKLTLSFYEEMLSMVSDSDTYRFEKVFSESRMVDKNALNEQIHLKKKRRFPTLTCRPVGGTLTGAVEVGEDGTLYCDDMVSDYEEALNAARMDKLYAAYLSQLYDRKLPGAKEFHIGTRWVPNDIIGREESSHEGDPRYRFRRIPALNDKGESNFMYGYGKAWTVEKWLEIKKKLVDDGLDDNWSAKYMCVPYWREGLMFPRDELNFYDGTLPDGEPDGVIAVCDTKDKGNDYACMPVGYIYGDRHFIHDVVCDNSKLETVEVKLVDCLIRNNVGLARFESNAAGGHVAREVQDACLLQHHAVEIRTKYSTTDKDTRINTDSPWIKRKCFFRSDSPSRDYDNFLNMLTGFSGVTKHAHDDAPDAMSMYKRFVDSVTVAHVEPARRLW